MSVQRGSEVDGGGPTDVPLVELECAESLRAPVTRLPRGEDHATVFPSFRRRASRRSPEPLGYFSVKSMSLSPSNFARVRANSRSIAPNTFSTSSSEYS